MVLPGSAVPLKVGVLSLVTSPPRPSPSVGALGAVVSIVNSKGAEGGLVLPAGSVTVAVMLELEADSANAAQSPEFKTLAHELALQIAAQNPRYVTSADVPQDVLESERSAYRAQLVEEKKAANIVDRIIEGKLQKFYADVCLMDQLSIRDDKQKVQTLVTSAAGQAGCDIRVRRFVRYALGD